MFLKGFFDDSVNLHEHTQTHAEKGWESRRGLREEASLRFAHQTGWLKLGAEGFTFHRASLWLPLTSSGKAKTANALPRSSSVNETSAVILLH